MRKIALLIVALFMAQCAMAQQFSLPILPEKMWPSEYANYEADVLNCCNYLLSVDPAFNQPKHEECTSFLLRWLTGTPDVHVVLHPKLVDSKNAELLLAYMAAWTRQALTDPDANDLLYAQVAEEEMLQFYSNYKSYVGKSKLTDKLLKEQEKGKLASLVTKALVH